MKTTLQLASLAAFAACAHATGAPAAVPATVSPPVTTVVPPPAPAETASAQLDAPPREGPVPEAVVATSPSDLWMILGRGQNVPTGQRVLVSHDGGDHWSDVSPHGMSATGHAVYIGSLTAIDGHHAWIHVDPDVGDDDAAVPDAKPRAIPLHLLRTVDGGKTWATTEFRAGRHSDRQRDVDDGPPMGGIRFVFHSVTRGWMSVEWQHGMNSMTSTLFSTGDGGATWHRVGDPPTSGVPEMASDGRLVLLGRGGSTWPTEVHLSTDGGRSWRSSRGPFAHQTDALAGESPDDFNLAGPFFDPGGGPSVVLFGLGSSAPGPMDVLRSDDRGESFRRMTTLTDVNGFTTCVSAQAMWVSAAEGLSVLHRSRDRGTHWERLPPRGVPPEQQLDGLWCAGTTVFALVGGSLLRSDDGGEGFHALPPVPVAGP